MSRIHFGTSARRRARRTASRSHPIDPALSLLVSGSAWNPAPDARRRRDQVR